MAATVVGSTSKLNIMGVGVGLNISASGRRSANSNRGTGTIPHPNRSQRGFSGQRSGAKTPAPGGGGGKGAGSNNGGAGNGSGLSGQKNEVPRTAVMPGPVESEDDLTIQRQSGTSHVSQVGRRAPRRPSQGDYNGVPAPPHSTSWPQAAKEVSGPPTKAELPNFRPTSPTPFDRPLVSSRPSARIPPALPARVGGPDAEGSDPQSVGSAPDSSAPLERATTTVSPAAEGLMNEDMQRSVGWGAAVAFVGLAFLALRSVESLPVVEPALQIVGASVSTYIAAKYMFSKDARAAYDEQAAAIADALNGVSTPAGVIIDQLKAKVSKLQYERDEAVAKLSQVNEGADAALEIALADRAAMAVLVQKLEVERDALREQVASLEAAVESIGLRMKGIDEMVTSELGALKSQNKALETLALQLAAERDAARAQVETANSDSLVQALTEQLDDAKAMTTMVKRVVEELREGSYGLTPSQEVFLRDQAKRIRSQYVDPKEPLSSQHDKVVKMAERMAEEFGAPEEWTIEYCEDYLRTSGHATSSSGVNGVEAPQSVPVPEAETSTSGSSNSSSSSSASAS